MKRLKDTHPTKQALDKAMVSMDFDKITLHVKPNAGLMLSTEDGLNYDLLDADSGGPVIEFPPMCEYILVVQD